MAGTSKPGVGPPLSNDYCRFRVFVSVRYLRQLEESVTQQRSLVIVWFSSVHTSPSHPHRYIHHHTGTPANHLLTTHTVQEGLYSKTFIA